VLDPVTNNEPVIVVFPISVSDPDILNEPVIVTFWLSVLTKDAVCAKDELTANDDDTALDEETAKDADIILFDPNGPNTFEPVINDDVCALIAQLEVPNKDPVNELAITDPDVCIPVESIVADRLLEVAPLA
jgi:hypothetical protein